MVKYLTEYGQVKGNVHGKKFFSVAEESEKTHKREHSKDIESKFEVKRKEDSTIPRERGFVHAMPLLRLEPGYAPSRLFDHYYSINDNRHVTNLPPVDASREALHIHNKETPQADNVYTFPLLHLDKEASRPWVGGEMNGYHHGVPRLVPPEVIINYEQQKYHKEMSKFRGVYRENVKNAHMRDWQNRLAFGDQTGQSKGGYYPHPDEMGPIQLLHANIEPFEAEGDRHNITRRRRRRQKDKDGKTSKSKETESESRSESTRSQRTPRSKEHDVSDIDNNRGYVIPPGSYNCELRYKHDVSIYPTPAEIHLNAITHKDAKPRDHGVNQDVSTSMDTNGLDAAGKSVRFKEPDEVTSADAVNQYCEAATGLSSTGHVIAPEIFFGLRFGQAKEEQSSVDEGKDDQQSGRSYINVVDIDTSILNSIPEKEDQVTARPPAQPTSSVSPRADEMEPSIAELHYNAMRLKDGDSAIPSVSDRLTVQLLDGGMTADRYV
uniref:Uncharacterized protein LOC102808382 n=1 Tax=Saccoglossus kowalevskii TaxID=10224 RepID=A0ABM0M808_SACKO|nr:PREDICTED: uncharacterized protein LOC102808382 [Saccoglossus kowalevskii]